LVDLGLTITSIRIAEGKPLEWAKWKNYKFAVKITRSGKI
jgi:hypothetical protein